MATVFDPVQESRTRTEFIKKELRGLTLRTHFFLSPGILQKNSVAPKVNVDYYTTPRQSQESNASVSKTPQKTSATGKTLLTTNAEQVDRDLMVTREVALEAKVLAEIRRPNLTPRQKFDEPLTSQMQYGWYETLPTARWGTWRRPAKKSDISAYSETYCRLTGVSPYTTKLKINT
eukprot:GEMP01035774.1.p1 GENE.GEMP01035774.1~~GEMP01035774.1.p1  ORF type:complete len:191 (+),score=24.97 GEMP01035774.1:48-575(+)